jgi:tRNA A-37 threonylcarbamoyl transferase component Bud32
MSGDPLDSPDLERLAALVTLAAPGGPELDEALRAFAHLRTTADEHRAVDWLVTRHARAPLPEALLVAVAGALVDRGDRAGAFRALAGATSSPGLMMRAELAAHAGAFGAARALVERVLSRDLDWPGAREKHASWKGKLAGPDRPGRIEPAATGAFEEASTHFEICAPVVADLSSCGSSGPFELVREVGRGGTGAVYLARERVLARTVALKIYHRPQRDRAQLLHEARVASALAGPGVIRVFDVHPQQGWLVMQWASVGALGTLLRTREAPGHAATFAGTEPLAWALALARTLARIHAAGWVHHDIKPANVVLRAPGDPLLGDFGAARRIGEPSPPGSPGYVSPERMAGRPSDPRDDVYGFGRVLEDALDALDLAGGRWQRWRALADACTGPDAGRPRAGAELLATCEAPLERAAPNG